MPSPSKSSGLISTPSLSPSLAQTLMSASLAYAGSIKVPINIWIFDPSLHPLLFHRMEGAKLTSIDIAYNKALTAAGHRLSTDKYGDKVNGLLHGIGRSNGGRFCTIAGGEPIFVDGVCVGGVGVSGGLPSEDKDIALAGINHLLRTLSANGPVKAKL
ncbi:uncharacterized protein MKK02DRAFT_42121 [Dioszegia hungarica]|uniref:DUF336-domain-containing protein n=1 Tax=Dioszegia hungarica TaxID=4972 RepID=A0AA38HC46_9TREE|nr:uncharacterized protein MKK02DRAFT_42121 [Dioszegia hungarica]KAI9637750.1 hypothetical protein MKK02DRAFT_42121 [Dioszegia hungarica]